MTKHTLTVSQRNVLHTEAYYKGTALSNICCLALFCNPVNPNSFEKAVFSVLSPNDVFRLKLKDEGYYTISDDEIHIEERHFDKIGDIYIFADKAACTPLSGDNLYRFVMLFVENRCVGYVFVLHHFIADGYSAGLLVNEIAEVYAGNEPQVRASYTVFSEKCANTDCTKSERVKQFWHDKYSNISEIGYITGIDRSASVSAKRISYALTNDEAEFLQSFSISQRVSPAVIAEAALALYISTVSGAENAGLCILSSNRMTKTELSAYGCFNTIIPIAPKIDLSKSFVDLCKDITSEHFSAYRNASVCYSDILSASGKSQPLFDCMVSYQEQQLTDDAKTLYSSLDWIKNGCSELPLELNIYKADGKTLFHYDFQTAAFTESEVNLLHKRLMAILLFAALHPDFSLSEVSILCDDDIKAYEKLNNTECEITDGCLLDRFVQNAKEYPDRTALCGREGTWSYDTLLKKACGVAKALKSVTNNKSVVAVSMKRSFAYIAAIYGVILSGNTYLPIDTDYPTARKEYMLKNSGAAAVITDDDGISCSVPVIKAKDITSGNTSDIVKSSPDDTAYVIYTSGSTGEPKGVMISHKSIVNRIAWMNSSYGMDEDDIVLHKTQFTFDVSVWELFWFSEYGRTLCILPPDAHKDPAEILDYLNEYAVTKVHFVPSMLGVFLQYCELHKDKLPQRTMDVFTSGEALLPAHAESFYSIFPKSRLHNLYGPTECTVDVTYHDVEKEHKYTSIPIGKPLANTYAYIVAKNGKLLPADCTGELCIGGILVGKGYLNNTALTNERFIDNPFADKSGRLYKTGDIAKLNVSGEIEYLGRNDNQVKLNGQRLDTGEIENAALRFSGIDECAVCCVKVSDTRQYLHLFYTSEEIIDEKAFISHLRQSLPAYMIPARISRIDRIPHSSSGKVDRKKLVEQSLQSSDEVQTDFSGDEKVIADIISQVTEGSIVISGDTDITRCGIDSITMLRIVIELEKAGFEISVRDIYEHPYIHELALCRHEHTYDAEDEKYRDISDINGKDMQKNAEGDILLTGASGLLGVHILCELLKKHPDKSIYCLVRSEQRLIDNIHRYFGDALDMSRIKPVIGDITQDNLGMDEETYKALKVGIVWHSAANVNHFCTEQESMRDNYVGTCNIIQFAKDSKSELHYISTVSVSGDFMTVTDGENHFDENTLCIGQHYRDNVYAHSKYMAERAIIAAVREGLPACIYRIGNLVWRYADGAFQKSYEKHDFYCMMKAFLNIGCIPQSAENVLFDLTPVDEAAKAVTALSEMRKTSAYMIYAPKTLRLLDFIAHFSVVNTKSDSEFFELLQECAKTDRTAAVLAGYISSVKSMNSLLRNTDSTRTVKALKECGYTWPDYTDTYIEYFDIWRER